MKTAIFFLAAGVFAADPAAVERGKGEEKRSCVGCHSLRITATQRLSRAAWEKELDKMVRWGAVIKDRESLMEYLIATYGDDKPVPTPEKSAEGRK